MGLTRTSLLALAGVMTVACWAAPAQPEDAGARQQRGSDEDARLAKLLEKAFKKPQTERERVFREFSQLDREHELGLDFNQWFERVAGSQPVWSRATITKMDIAEIFDRMAERLHDSSGTISRQQFLLYAREFWTEERSPLWKEPKAVDAEAEADKVFRKLDQDGDGYLDGVEIPDLLRRSLPRWDRDRDGRTSAEEYRAYFTRRFEAMRLEVLAARTQNGLEAERPRVIRAGKLPAGLPPWFAELDVDRDGQVALYEWRSQARRTAAELLAEFRSLDRDDDGFITAAEALTHANAAPAAPSR